MSYNYFEKMDRSQANHFLEEYLQRSEAELGKLKADIEKEGIIVDYSIESIKNLSNWIAKHVFIEKTGKDESLPRWIKNDDIYLKNLFEFDDNSLTLIVVLSFYLGCCFIRNYSVLQWSIGNRDTALQK